VELLLQTARAAAVAQATAGMDMVAPDLLNAEVLSVLRRLEQRAALTSARAALAVTDLMTAPIRRLSTLPLITDIWLLRANVSPYDACYVALARALGCALVTADARLVRVPNLGIVVMGV
jgi:predicted nucleic acid-binding protein